MRIHNDTKRVKVISELTSTRNDPASATTIDGSQPYKIFERDSRTTRRARGYLLSPMSAFWRTAQDICAINEFVVDDDNRLTVLRANETAHFAAIPRAVKIFGVGPTSYPPAPPRSPLRDTLLALLAAPKPPPSASMSRMEMSASALSSTAVR
jgi:hypothetical protein